MEAKVMQIQTFGNVFDALADTPAEAANLKARSELLLAFKARVRSWNLSQEVAPNRLGITRPRLNDLLQGKMTKLSLDALVILATASGLAVHIQIAEAA
jgi:predicted XRE-type DNA-binding protein